VIDELLSDIIGIARRRGRELDWSSILERLAPLANAKDSPHLLTGVQKLRDDFSSGANP
jgi:hypothetical protein